MRRKLTVLFLLLMLVWLPSCGREPDPSLPENGEDTTAPEPVTLTLDAGFVVVRAEGAGQAVIDAASALRRALSDATGGNVKISDDWLAPGGAPAACEILCGATNRDGGEGAQPCRANDWRIELREGKVWLMGGSDAAVSAAAAALIDGWLTPSPATLTLEAGADGVLAAHQAEYTLEDITIGGRSLRDCTFVVPTTVDAALGDVYLREARELSRALCDLCGWRARVTRSADTGEGMIRFGGWEYDPQKWRMTGSALEAGSTTALSAAVDALTGAVGRAKAGSTVALDELIPDGGDVSDILTLPRAEGTTLRVMNSNVLWLPPEGAQLSTASRMAVIAETIRLYAPDVVTMQEMQPGVRAQLMNALIGADPAYTAVTTDNWLVILYRADVLTLLDSGEARFDPNDTCHAVTWAVFETKDGKPLIVTDAHYQLNTETGGATEGNRLRLANSQQILALVKDLLDRYPGAGAIAGGDYFYGKGSPAYEAMISGGYIDPAQTATEKRMGEVRTYHALGEPNSTGDGIDLILATPELSPLVHRIMVRNPYLMHATDHTPEYVDFGG